MIMTHSWVLHFLWLLPLVIVNQIFFSRRRAKALENFADTDLLKKLTGDHLKGRSFVKNIFALLALSMILFALSGPRWGSHYQEVTRKGVDIMVLVDVSKSMLAEDVAPSRLVRAKREIMDLIRVVRGDRIGLIAFAGAAFVQCPLTLDYDAVTMFLNSVETELIPVPGTDLGAAIETGLSSFDYKSKTDKVMILITDGEDNEQKGVEAARKASEKQVRIFVFGIGDTSGGPIPDTANKGGFIKDENGNLVLSKLDEEGLKKIADITDGTYVRSMAGDLDLDILYFDGIKSKTEDADLKSGKIKVYEERFTIFVLAALFFLLLEGVIPERKRN